MVERFIPGFGRGNGNLKILLNLRLADEVTETAWSQAGIQWRILGVRLPRYNASDCVTPGS